MTDYLYLARDLDNELYLYHGKPQKEGTKFYPHSFGQTATYLGGSETYPEVTFKNSPLMVTLQLPSELCNLH